MHNYLLGTLLAIPLLAAAEPRTCLVVGVSDGDTLAARCGILSSGTQAIAV